MPSGHCSVFIWKENLFQSIISITCKDSFRLFWCLLVFVLHHLHKANNDSDENINNIEGMGLICVGTNFHWRLFPCVCLKKGILEKYVWMRNFTLDSYCPSITLSTQILVTKISVQGASRINIEKSASRILRRNQFLEQYYGLDNSNFKGVSCGRRVKPLLTSLHHHHL